MRRREVVVEAAGHLREAVGDPWLDAARFNGRTRSPFGTTRAAQVSSRRVTSPTTQRISTITAGGHAG